MSESRLTADEALRIAKSSKCFDDVLDVILNDIKSQAKKGCCEHSMYVQKKYQGVLESELRSLGYSVYSTVLTTKVLELYMTISWGQTTYSEEE